MLTFIDEQWQKSMANACNCTERLASRLPVPMMHSSYFTLVGKGGRSQTRLPMQLTLPIKLLFSVLTTNLT